MASGAKKTNGIVTHVTERFGFIELTNKNIPISQVYFDFTSFQGNRGNDLSKIYPKGTTVSFTFIDSKGDHKVKHRAVNLSKAHPRGPGGQQAHKEQGFPPPPRSQNWGNEHRGHVPGTASSQKWDPSGNSRPPQGQTRYPRELGHGSGKSSNQRHTHKDWSRQSSRDHGETRKESLGSIYPHENLFQEFQPSEPDYRLVEVPPTAGQVLREAVASGLTKLAEKISDMPPKYSNHPTETLTPPNMEPPESKAARKKRKGKKQPRAGQQDKAFNEPNEAEEKMPLQCSEDSGMNSQHSLAEYHVSEAMPQSAQEPGSGSRRKNKNRSKTEKFAEDPEARTFFNLLGKDLGVAVKSKIKSLGLKNVNGLLLLRLAVGKQPNMRIFKNGESSNHVIDGVKPVELEDLHRLLRHDDTVKTATSSHYGVKGTLHSIRSIEQSGKLTALTLFFQLHESHDGLGLDIIERKRFTAVVRDLESCPQKYLHNYLRCKSQEMAKSKDVLVLDIDGQLSGSDDNAHPSLGDVTRISCSSASELPAVITGAMEHLHECVIAIGVDSTQTLQALQKLTTKGAQVYAEITSDLKPEAEALFAA